MRELLEKLWKVLLDGCKHFYYSGPKMFQAITYFTSFSTTLDNKKSGIVIVSDDSVLASKSKIAFNFSNSLLFFCNENTSVEEIQEILKNWSNIFISPSDLTKISEVVSSRELLKSEDRFPLNIFFYDIGKYMDEHSEILKFAVREWRKYNATCYFFADKEINSNIIDEIKGNIIPGNTIIEE